MSLLYLEVHKIHQFCDLRLKDLHGFLINFHSVRLFVTFHLGENKHDIQRLQPLEDVGSALGWSRPEVGRGLTGRGRLERMRAWPVGRVGSGWDGAPAGWPESSSSRCTA